MKLRALGIVETLNFLHCGFSRKEIIFQLLTKKLKVEPLFSIF